LRRTRVNLGSFFNVNQPDPTQVVSEHDSTGRTLTKNEDLWMGPSLAHVIPGVRTFRLPAVEASLAVGFHSMTAAINVNSELSQMMFLSASAIVV